MPSADEEIPIKVAILTPDETNVAMDFEDELEKFEIFFDDPRAVYTSGDEIAGHLSISLRHPTKMQMVRLRFVGAVRLSPVLSEEEANGAGGKKAKNKEKKTAKEKPVKPKKEKKNPKNPQQEPLLSGSIVENGVSKKAKPTPTKIMPVPKQHSFIRTVHQYVHLDTTIELLVRRPGQEFAHEFVLPVGDSVLPFSFPLPRKPMPVSFESEHASVRYACEATICKPWKSDYVAAKAFTVLPPVMRDGESLAADSNHMGYCLRALPANFPKLTRQLSADEYQMSKSCCFAAGRIGAELCVDKQVFNIGESLAARLKIANLSRKPVKKVHAKLVQMITLKVLEGQSSAATEDAAGEHTYGYERVVAEKSITSPSDEKPPSVNNNNNNSEKMTKKDKKDPKKQPKIHWPSEWSTQIDFKVPAVCPTTVVTRGKPPTYEFQTSATLMRVDYRVIVDVEFGAKERIRAMLPVILVGAPYLTHYQRSSPDDVTAVMDDDFLFAPCHFGKVAILSSGLDTNRRLWSPSEYTPIYPSLP